MADSRRVMADQAPSTHPETPKGESRIKRSFPQKGQPVIVGVNRIGLWSLYIKELRRFLKVQLQTVWAPAITTLLFLIIFTVALGRSGREILGVPFGSFVAPGLIMMGMMQNAYANASFSLLAGKLQGTIIDLLMPPLNEAEMMIGIIAAAVTRALMVGCTVAVAMALWPGVTLQIAHLWAIVWFGLMGAILLSIIGLLASIWADKFDHNAAITNFVIAPLSLLSGTFYVITNLSPFFQSVSRLNPFFYMISGFRYGFLGQSDVGGGENGMLYAAIGVGVLNVVLGWLTYCLLKSGWKLKT